MEGVYVGLGQVQQPSSGSGGVLLIVLLALYFVPTIVAVSRKVPNVGSVIVINLLLGWTLIGWVVAFAMAVRSVPPEVAFVPQPVTHVPPRRDPQIKTVPPTFTLKGERYLFGYTMDPAGYGIWDSMNPESAIERFPYTDHG